jgi:hypothetical protein
MEHFRRAISHPDGRALLSRVRAEEHEQPRRGSTPRVGCLHPLFIDHPLLPGPDVAPCQPWPPRLLPTRRCSRPVCARTMACPGSQAHARCARSSQYGVGKPRYAGVGQSGGAQDSRRAQLQERPGRPEVPCKDLPHTVQSAQQRHERFPFSSNNPRLTRHVLCNATKRAP